jgi:hypothetical protein
VTGYGLDGRGVGVAVPVQARFSSSPRQSDPDSYPVGAEGCSPGGDGKYVDLYMYSSIRLHGVVFN